MVWPRLPWSRLPAGAFADAGSGFRNLGNTCFMNATLQCVGALPPLLQWLVGHARACAHDRPAGGAAPACFNCMLSALYAESLDGAGGGRVVVPRALAAGLASLGPLGRFVVGRQEDANEFLVHLLDALEIHSLERARLFGVATDAPAAGCAELEDAVRTAAYGRIARLAIEAHEAAAAAAVSDGAALVEAAAGAAAAAAVPAAAPSGSGAAAAAPLLLPPGALPFCELFRGRLLSRVCCLVFGARSDTRDESEALSLELPAGCTSVESALGTFTASERLSGANAYECARCRAKVDAEKRLAIDVPPQLLTVHLKRFAFRRRGGATKIAHAVSFGEELELGAHATFTRAQLSAAYAAGGEPARGADGLPTPDSLRLRYVLCSALVHAGRSPTSGHYFAFARALEAHARRVPVAAAPSALAAPAALGAAARWFSLNDASKSVVPFASVAAQQAYMLFYVAAQPRVVAALADAAEYVPPVPRLAGALRAGAAPSAAAGGRERSAHTARAAVTAAAAAPATGLGTAAVSAAASAGGSHSPATAPKRARSQTP